MANTTYFLKKIKVDNVIRDLIAASNGDNVAVVYNGSNMTLSQALADIFTAVSALPSSDAMNSAITTAVSNLINGAPEAGDTLKELFDLIGNNSGAVELLQSAVTGKVDKEEGKGLSANDFTNDFKTALEALIALGIDADKVAEWDSKASTAVATASANGLMSKEDKARLDGLRGVYIGATIPEGLEDGTLIVTLETEGE